MIVLSSALVLSEQDAANPVIGWRNIVTIENVEATNAHADYPITNVANPATDNFWKSVITSGTIYLTIETGTNDDIDYLGVAGHNLAGKTISVEVCTSDFYSSPQTWTEVIAPFIPGDNAPLIFRWTKAGRQGVRLKIATTDEAPLVAVLYCGALLVMERSIKIDTDHTPINMGRMSKIATGRSENGKYLGRIVVGEWNESQADFSYITPAFFRAYVWPFIEASDDTPFFFCWKPDDYPFDCGYVWMTADPKPMVDPVTDRFHLQMKYQGIVAS